MGTPLNTTTASRAERAGATTEALAVVACAAGTDAALATEAAEAPLPVPGSVDDPFGPPPEPPAAHPASEESKNGTTAR